MFKPILILLLLCSSAFAQVKVDVEPFSAIIAKSARVEPLVDSVAVIVTDRIADRSGAFLTIASESKWATPYIDASGVEISQSQADAKRWIMFAKPGKYRVQIIEFDPERGPRFTPVEVVIGTPTKPDEPGTPEKPEDPKPPVGDFVALRNSADELADKLNDPPTRASLAKAYEHALNAAAGKDYAQSREIVTMSRFIALNSREGASLQKDWTSGFLKPIDAKLSQLVQAGDVAAYALAITAIQKGLVQ